MDSNPDPDHLSHVGCDPDSNPDLGPGARVNAAFGVYVVYICVRLLWCGAAALLHAHFDNHTHLLKNRVWFEPSNHTHKVAC